MSCDQIVTLFDAGLCHLQGLASLVELVDLGLKVSLRLIMGLAQAVMGRLELEEHLLHILQLLFLLLNLSLETLHLFLQLLLSSQEALVVRVRKVDAVLLAGRNQVGLQSIDLHGQVLDERGLRDLSVHLWPVLDRLGPLRVVQSVQGLVQAQSSGRDRGDDARLGLAAKRVPQQPGKLTVTVRDVGLALHQGADDAPKGEQGLVDLPSLSCPFLLRSTPGDVLRSCEVNQVELSALYHLIPFWGRLLDVNGDGEDAVRPARLLVQLGLRRLPPRGSSLENFEDLLRRFHDLVLQTSHDHASSAVLAQLVLRVVLPDAEQVRDLLVVELQVRNLYRVLRPGALKGLEDLLYRARDHSCRRIQDTRLGVPLDVSPHGVRLSRSRLAVSEDSAVETVQDLAHYRSNRSVVDIRLCRVLAKDSVEGESPADLLVRDLLGHRDLPRGLAAFHDLLQPLRLFLAADGSAAEDHLNVHASVFPVRVRVRLLSLPTSSRSRARTRRSRPRLCRHAPSSLSLSPACLLHSSALRLSLREPNSSSDRSIERSRGALSFY
mmetsp:Transcript_12673/g.35408  ORF Transcript_12673/g.35408 Transcript_12673/m.35408 type:complete len:550 (-) Transcript_12673:87-1736(-)